MNQAGIVGTGICLPEERRDNQWYQELDLLAVDAVLDEAGVAERRICAPGQSASDLEAAAVRQAAERAGIDVAEIDLLLVGPALQDQPMPGNAALVQHKAGAVRAAALNVETACTTLISQLAVARAMIGGGLYQTVACVASACWTKVADYSEKNCMLLGDGAAALIVRPVSPGRGILAVHLETDGSCWGAIGCAPRLPRQLIENYQQGDYLGGCRERVLFYVDRGGAGIGEIRDSGPVKTPAAARKALAAAGLTAGEVDFLICHNPTQALVTAWREELGFAPEQTHTTLHCYGNMSGASLGVNLHEAVTAGRIKEGDLVLCCAPGAGYHYAAAVFRWGR